jgi:hypothetical protein
MEGENIISIRGSYNTFLGIGAGAVITSAIGNTGIGEDSLHSITEMPGQSNTALGYKSLYSLVSATDNTAIGNGALNDTVTGGYNVAVGSKSLWNSTGAFNTSIGYENLRTLSTGSRNVSIGYRAGFFETGSDKLFIDNRERASEADGRIKALIYGVMDDAVANQHLHFNASYVTIGVDDTDQGRLFLYGAATGSNVGGSTRLYLAADHDTSIQYYHIRGYQDDLQFGQDSTNDLMRLDVSGHLLVKVGYVDSKQGFLDNGVAGVDGSFTDADGNVCTVSGGIITAITPP